MQRLIYILPILVIFLLSSCKTKVPTATGPYNDDLTMYRIKVAPTPKVEVQDTASSEVATATVTLPQNHINTQLDEKLDLIARKNQEIKTTQGYRLLVYSGRNRKEGTEIERDLVIRYGRKNVKFRYDPPNFVVLVGNFLTKIEAHRTYIELEEKYPTTLVISDKIEIDLQQYIIEE